MIEPWPSAVRGRYGDAVVIVHLGGCGRVEAENRRALFMDGGGEVGASRAEKVVGHRAEHQLDMVATHQLAQRVRGERWIGAKVDVERNGAQTKHEEKDKRGEHAERDARRLEVRVEARQRRERRADRDDGVHDRDDGGRLARSRAQLDRVVMANRTAAPRRRATVARSHERPPRAAMLRVVLLAACLANVLAFLERHANQANDSTGAVGRADERAPSNEAPTSRSLMFATVPQKMTYSSIVGSGTVVPTQGPGAPDGFLPLVNWQKGVKCWGPGHLKQIRFKIKYIFQVLINNFFFHFLPKS